MRTYALVTGVIFALLVVLHIWRMLVESHSLASEPWYLAITAIAGLLSAWAFHVARRMPRG